MNFLSHFYFDRYTNDCYMTLGTVLPDLLKNADKTIILHPDKMNHSDPAVNAIIKGWHKHLEVDRHFHSSDFFTKHSREVKKRLLPAITGSPVKAFFLGHVALELILDNLLLTTQQITVDDFYDQLEGCQIEPVARFLSLARLQDDTRFFKFYLDFKKSRYLSSYFETKEIAYALKRICMRIWKDPFTPKQEADISLILTDYRATLLDTFMSIFKEIESKLSVV